MCEEVASRVERAARRLRPPAWFRAAAASPRGFLLAAKRPSRLPPWPQPQTTQEPSHQQAADGRLSHSHSGSRSAPATLTRRRDRHRGSDAADEETWRRDAATLYATPLSSRRQRPHPDGQAALDGGVWDSTPPRRHRSQLTLRTASPAAPSDAGWSQEARRPYLGWRSLERLSRRPWTPEERLAASLLEGSGRSTPTAAPKKQSAATQQHEPSGAGDSRERTAAASLSQESAPNAPQGGTTSSSSRKASGLNALREGTDVSSLHKESVPAPTSPITSGRRESVTLSTHVTALSIPTTEHNIDAETASSSGKISTKLVELSTGSLAPRPAEEDCTRNWDTEYENSQYLERDTLSDVSCYPEQKDQKNSLRLSTKIKTLLARTTDPDEDFAHTSHKDQPVYAPHFRSAVGDTDKSTMYREKSPRKVPDSASGDTKEEKATTLQHQYLNGPTQLPTKLKALSVTTRYTNGDISSKANDDTMPARDLLARSYDTAPLPASNAISEPTTSSGKEHYRTTNHLNSETSPSPHDRTLPPDQNFVSESGGTRKLPSVELRTRSLEVTLPQRLTTSDTSRKLSIQEQFWVAENHSPSAVQEDPSVTILPLVKRTPTAPPKAHSGTTNSTTANRKSAPSFLTSTPIGASPGAETNTSPHPVQYDYTPDATSPTANGTKMFDVNHLRSVDLCTRSIEIPLPQVTSAIADSPPSNFSPSAATKNPPAPNIKEGSPQSSSTTPAVSMPPVPRDRTFCIESPTVLRKSNSSFSALPAVEFQSPPSDVTLLEEVSTVATTKSNSDCQETEPMPSGLNDRHSLPASPLVETSLTTIRVSPSPEVVEYQAVYSDSSPLLGRKPFTVKHVEAPGGHRTKSSAENTKSREISLSPVLPKPFEPMAIPHSKIPVLTASKPFSEKETALTTQTETNHKPMNHIRPNERTQQSLLPVTSVIRRPSYRVATRNELNPSIRKKRPGIGVNIAEVRVSTSIAPPADKSRTKTAPIVKPPRLRTKVNATSSPKPPPRQKHSMSPLATVRSDNMGPNPHNTELHLPNGVSPLPYSALRMVDSKLPQNTADPANTMSVSFKLPVSSESDTATAKRTVSKQSIPALQHVPSPSLLTPLKYKPCTTTDL